MTTESREEGSIGAQCIQADQACRCEQRISRTRRRRVASIRITRGTFRLMHHFLIQVERTLQLNQMQVVTKEVVEVARENLVMGQAEEREQKSRQNLRLLRYKTAGSTQMSE